ncbi:MAG: lipoprotein N-acyltransferase Lnb domain-containing protein [Pseudobdellovibrionaceae bacterium]
MKYCNIFSKYINIFMYFSLLMFIGPLSFAQTTSRFKNQIDPKKVKYVSYMLAAASGAGQSSFGHSYLLFKSDEYVSPGDFAIEFVAAVNPSDLNYIRGLGIFPYDRKVILEKFNVIKKDITIAQNRDLEIYDLKLSEYQRAEIVEKINKILNAGTMGQYSFLSANCADAVSSVLSSIGIRLTGITSKVPTELPQRLKEKGMILKTTVFKSIENERLDAVEKYSGALKSLRVPKYYRSLDTMFDEATETQQLFSLLLANQNKQLSVAPTDIDTFVSTFWLTLPAVVKKQFKNMLAVPEGSVRLNIQNTQRPFYEYIVRSANLECEDSGCLVAITFSYNDQRSDFLTSKYPVKDFLVKGDKVYFGDLLIGVRLREQTPFSHDTVVAFAATPIVTKYQVNGVDIADIGFIIEKNLANSFSKKAVLWNRDVISQTNTDPQHPMCFTILHLQQALSERVIFAPELPRLSIQESLNLLKGLLVSNSIAVVPGFANAYEFTKVIHHEDFVKEIYPVHQQTYEGLMNGMGEWFKTEALSAESLKAMSVITHELNISVPVIFRRNNSSSEVISHSILITDMRDEGDHYALSGYDPNYTYTDDFGTLSKATLIMHTKSYGDVNLALEKMDLDQSVLNLQFINSTAVRELLVKQAGNLKKYLFSTYEILRMQ